MSNNISVPSNEELEYFSTPNKNANLPPISTSSSTDLDYFNEPITNQSWIKPKAPPIKEQLSNAPALMAREGASQLYSLPSTFAHMIKGLGMLGEKQQEEEGEELSSDVKAMQSFISNKPLEAWKYLNEKFPNVFPNISEAREITGAKIEEHLGRNLPEEGRGRIEKAAIGVGAASPALLFPGSAAQKLIPMGVNAIMESTDLSDKQKMIGNATLPVLIDLTRAILSRRYTPQPGELTELYQRGRELGMTDEQLAPILATEQQVARFGRHAQAVRGTREAYNQTHEALGNVIEGIQNRPGNNIRLPQQIENNLVDGLERIANNIRGRTHQLAPHEETLVNFIENAINDIRTNGSSPQQIIGTWRSINRIQAGRTELRRMMPIFEHALESVNPQLARDFISGNRLYSRFLTNLGEINPGQFNAFIDAGEMQKVLGAVFSGDVAQMSSIAKNVATLTAWRRISSSILTDPVAQSLSRNVGRAIRNGRRSSAISSGIQFKKYVRKHFPEIYEDTDWEKLGFEN